MYPLTGMMRMEWLGKHLSEEMTEIIAEEPNAEAIRDAIARQKGDSYAVETGFVDGWPVGFGPDDNQNTIWWPIHCYGYIGVARDYAPDTGTGAELYTIIGQPQRHMDRNLAVVGRVIEGMEHLSSLPRGSGDLGFYTEDEAHLRTPILSVRLASELDEPPPSSNIWIPAARALSAMPPRGPIVMTPSTPSPLAGWMCAACRCRYERSGVKPAPPAPPRRSRAGR